MKKKKILIITSIIICLITVVVLSSKGKNDTFKSGGVTYALTLDGVKQNSFPSKGLYKVTTECVNATCKWDYDAWKLYIEKVTGDISCNISFTTIIKNNLNNYIISLSDTTQGTGQLVHETFNAGNFTNATRLTETEYGAKSQYSSSYYYDTSGTTVTNAFTYSNNEWTSNPTNLTSETFYHINFAVPAGAYYQLCYELSSGNYNNHIFLFKGSYQQSLGNSDVLEAGTATQSGCVYLGYMSTETNYRIVQYASTDIATFKFYIQKATNTTLVDAGYRYEGKNPNNYIWFNNELWRIIGVFDAETHGQTGLNLVKIIRANPIGGLAWNKSNSNNWANSSLYKLLNPVSGDASSGAYYKKQNGNDNAYCYRGNCDYSNNLGIDEVYRSMIKSVTWKVGGHLSSEALAKEFYTAERGNATANSSYSSEVTGYIGLMHLSDYGYSVLASSCGRDKKLSEYNSQACGGQSWLSGQGIEWTLTPVSSYFGSVFYIDSSGRVFHANDNDTYYGYATRPSLYLDASVYVIDGDGSVTDPYIIGI